MNKGQVTMTEIIFEKVNEFIFGYVLSGTIFVLIVYGYVCIMAKIERKNNNDRQTDNNR